MAQLFQLANFCKHSQAEAVGEKYSFNVNVRAMQILNYITVFAVKIAIIPLNKITVALKIELTSAVLQKTLCISLFTLKLKKLALCYNVV